MLSVTVLLIVFFTLLIAYKDAIKDRIHLYRLMWAFSGPLSFPIIGTVWQFKWDVGELSLQLIEWGTYYAQQGHGVVAFWLGPNAALGIVSPDYAKELLESNSLITKGDEYDILFPWLGTGLLTSTGEKWRQRRKMLTPAFHFKTLNEFIVTHDYQAKVMMDQIRPFAESGEEFDMFPYIKRMALDIICETSMGTTIDAQHNHDHQYVRSVQRLNEIAFDWQRKPWLKIKLFWYLTGVGFEYDKHLQLVTDFTRNVINEKWEEFQNFTVAGRESGDKRKMAFLDLLLELRSEGKLDFEDVREEVDTFMFEGHDTTSSSMGWTLWSIAHNPDVQEKIIEEVDSIFGNSDRDCTNDDLKQLKYLEKCIKESLRMFPAVPIFARKIEQDVKINGSIFPKGCTALMFPLLLQRNPVYWKDPNTYNPENFSEESLATKHAYADVPFSAGPRNCIGQKFALMEEKTCLSWFFRNFRVSSRRKFEDNLPQPEVIIKPSLGFPLVIRSRQ